MTTAVASREEITQSAEAGAIRPFQHPCSGRRNSPNCAGASTRQSGLNGKRSRMQRKAFSSRRCRRSRAIGRQSMTGARSRRN